MKCSRILRVFGMVIILFLLAVTVPAAPARAARDIKLDPEQGSIDDKITVTGTGFNKSTATTDKYAAIYFSNQAATTLDDIGTKVTSYETVKDGIWLDENGDFQVTFKVPSLLNDGRVKAEVEGGTYYVYLCQYSGTTIVLRIAAAADFTVIKGEISLSPQKGTVGTLVEISGTDFPARTDLAFKYDGTSIPIESGQKRTGTTGSFVTAVRIPESTAGSHNISAIAASTEVSATFWVKPEITITPSSGEANSLITVSGTGFGEEKQVTVWFQSIQLATTTTSALGSFSRSFNIPSLGAGIYTVEAEGEANLAKAKFTIAVPVPLPTPTPTPTPTPSPLPAISSSATSVYVGQGIVISGTGFRAGGMIVIKYDDELVTATSANSNGLFAASFTVPSSKHGSHTITASDGTNTSELKFNVESIPPPVPTLLLPEMEARVTVPIHFDWQDVADDSRPVTYTIQIATRPDFSATSTVLEKTGLTKTEYAVTEQESMRLDVGKNPYYWRARAIDGASNEGNWTNTGIFYAVSSGMPVWAIITIAILGALFLFGFGYLVSMKSKPAKRERPKLKVMEAESNDG
jgi:hypothetical protein